MSISPHAIIIENLVWIVITEHYVRGGVGGARGMEEEGGKVEKIREMKRLKATPQGRKTALKPSLAKPIDKEDAEGTP